MKENYVLFAVFIFISDSFLCMIFYCFFVLNTFLIIKMYFHLHQSFSEKYAMQQSVHNIVETHNIISRMFINEVFYFKYIKNI